MYHNTTKHFVLALQYGRDGSHLRVDRVDEIVSGYSQFTALASEASNGLSFGAAVPLRSSSSAATLSPMTGSTAAASTTSSSASSASYGAFSRPPPTAMTTISSSSSSSGTVAVPYSDTTSSSGASSSQRRRGGYSAEVQAAAQHGQPVAAAVSTANSGGNRAAAVAMPQFSMRSSSIGSGSSSDPLSDPVARDALKLLFAKDGNFVQVTTTLCHVLLLVLHV
jgi:hypothetical protein